MEGLIMVQFFDLRCAKQALKDMQSRHLMRQQQFRMNQEEMMQQKNRHSLDSASSSSSSSSTSSSSASPASSLSSSIAETGSNPGAGTTSMDTQAVMITANPNPPGYGDGGACRVAAAEKTTKGLICGHVVWAQYIAAWNMHVDDSHNQGTLVLFNVGSEVSLRELRQVFEEFGKIAPLPVIDRSVMIRSVMIRSVMIRSVMIRSVMIWSVMIRSVMIDR
jgi:hypothetical protein